MTETHERASRLVAEHLGAHRDKVTPDASFRDDLNADSLDTVELAVAVEDEFDLIMTDDETAEIFGDGKVSDLCDWLDRKLA